MRGSGGMDVVYIGRALQRGNTSDESKKRYLGWLRVRETSEP